MRYFVVACLVGLGLGVVLGLLLVMLGEAWESIDPNAAPAFLRRPASGVRALRSRVLALVDALTTVHPDANAPPLSQLGRDPGHHTRCAAC